MPEMTQQELNRLCEETGEKLRELLLPFMRAGVDVALSRDPKDQFYLADFTVPGQSDLKYQIMLGIPVFEGRPCGRLPIMQSFDIPSARLTKVTDNG